MGRVVVCLTAWEIKDRQAAQHLPGLLGQPCGLTAWEIKDRQAVFLWRLHRDGHEVSQLGKSKTVRRGSLLGFPLGCLRLTAWEIKDRQAESARQAVVAAPPSHSLGNQRPSGGDRHYKFPPPAFRLTAWEIKRPSGG